MTKGGPTTGTTASPREPAIGCYQLRRREEGDCAEIQAGGREPGEQQPGEQQPGKQQPCEQQPWEQQPGEREQDQRDHRPLASA